MNLKKKRNQLEKFLGAEMTFTIKRGSRWLDYEVISPLTEKKRTRLNLTGLVCVCVCTTYAM